MTDLKFLSRQRYTSAVASCGVQRGVAGGRVRRVQRAVPRRPFKGSGELGARAALNPRRARADAL